MFTRLHLFPFTNVPLASYAGMISGAVSLKRLNGFCGAEGALMRQSCRFERWLIGQSWYCLDYLYLTSWSLAREPDTFENPA